MEKLTTAHYEVFWRSGKSDAAGECRIVFLTDLHSACSPAESDRLFRAVRRCRPDLVLCGGDMIISRRGEDLTSAAELLGRIASKWPVYYASGNHEHRLFAHRDYFTADGEPMYDIYREQLTEAGVVWLENQDVHVTAGGIPFRICGLDLKGKYYGRLRVPHLPAGEIRDLFGEPDPSECTILLAHTPRMMKTYQDWGADITFCGHYHGGVMRIGKNRGLISPDLRVFPGNAYGIFPNQGKYVIVSSGCGEHTIPLRIRNPREIVCCTVRGC